MLSKSLKMELMDKPKSFREKLTQLIPEELHSRIKKLNNWFQESIGKLKQNTSDIEAFVQLSRNLKEIELKAGFFKELLKVTKEVIETTKKFQVDIKKEYVIMFNDFKNLEQYLFSQLIQVNDNLSKNQEVFSAEIRNQMVPQLMKECAKLEERIQNPVLLSLSTATALNDLKQMEAQLLQYKEKANRINVYEDVLQLPVTPFSELGSLIQLLSSRILLWESYKDWH